MAGADPEVQGRRPSDGCPDHQAGILPRGGPLTTFLDTGVLVALSHPKDANHATAVNLVAQQARQGQRLVTSDFVAAEVLNLVRVRIKSKAAEEQALLLMQGDGDQPGLVEVLIRVSGPRFSDSVGLYRKYRDQGLSFTDCSTLVTMRDEEIGLLATFDSGFQGLVPTIGLEP